MKRCLVLVLWLLAIMHKAQGSIMRIEQRESEREREISALELSLGVNKRSTIQQTEVCVTGND